MGMLKSNFLIGVCRSGNQMGCRGEKLVALKQSILFCESQSLILLVCTLTTCVTVDPGEKQSICKQRMRSSSMDLFQELELQYNAQPRANSHVKLPGSATFFLHPHQNVACVFYGPLPIFCGDSATVNMSKHKSTVQSSQLNFHCHLFS